MSRPSVSTSTSASAHAGGMIYLAHTGHLQFLGLILGFLAWILIMTTSGINEWRTWHVSNVSIISSGQAWVGIWKSCFYSHVLPELENCRTISISDSFVPVEIQVAQVMIGLAMICGLVANVVAALAMRMVYFSVEDRSNMRLLFTLGGLLYLLTGVLCLVPLVWNMTSVMNDNPIAFPPEFHLPSAPDYQYIGSAIGLGLFSSTLILISGLLFLCYCFTVKTPSSGDLLHDPWTRNTLENSVIQGRDNPSYQCEEAS